MKMVAKEAFPYAERWLEKGEEFLASEHDAEILRTLGKAEEAKPSRALQGRQLSAEQDRNELFQKPETEKVKRSYRRRDMRAEG